MIEQLLGDVVESGWGGVVYMLALPIGSETMMEMEWTAEREASKLHKPFGAVAGNLHRSHGAFEREYRVCCGLFYATLENARAENTEPLTRRSASGSLIKGSPGPDAACVRTTSTHNHESEWASYRPRRG